MKYIKYKAITALLSLAMLCGIQASVNAQNNPSVEIGLLECNVEGGVGYIFGSKKYMACNFKPSGQQNAAYYKGSITKFGLDIGFTTKSSIVWAVFAPTLNVKPGDLAGSYAGVSAEATTGVGVGANVLLGGLKGSITLQPLSVQNQEGLNVAAGVSGLTLTFQN